MRACHVNNAHDAVGAHHAHLWPYAIGLALVDGHEVVRLVQRVVDHLGVHQAVFWRERLHAPRGVAFFFSRRFLHAVQLLAQPLVGHLEPVVFFLKVQV